MSEGTNTEEVKEKKLMVGEITGDALTILENQNTDYSRVMFETGGWVEDGDVAVVYVKKFNRALLTQALMIIDKGELHFGEWVLINLRIGGVEKDVIVNDINMLHNFSSTAAYLIKPKIGAIKKK